MKFTVIDRQTGECVDVKKVCLDEDWISQFYIGETGDIMYCDERGNFFRCTFDRFEVVFEAVPVKRVEKTKKIYGRPSKHIYDACGNCEAMVGCTDKYCHECGQRLDWEVAE
jgi:hypothetical protein